MNSLYAGIGVRSLPELLQSAADGRSRLFVQFGGQGSGTLSELQRLYNEREDLRNFFEVGIDAVRDAAQRPEILKSPYYRHGFELRDWLRGRNLPPEEYALQCSISFPLTLLAQLGHVYVLERMGLPLPAMMSAWGDDGHMVSGHSQGVFAAAAFGLGKSGDAFLQSVYDFTHWFAVAGYYVMSIYAESAPPMCASLREECVRQTGGEPAPLVAVSGPGAEELQAWLHTVNEKLCRRYGAEAVGAGLQLSLRNTDTSWVVTGHTLYAAEFFLEAPPSGMNCERAFIPVSAPFHREDILKPVYRALAEDSVVEHFPYRGADLRIKTLSCFDGRDLRRSDELSMHCARTMLGCSVDWPGTLQRFQADDPRPGVLVDFGPGRISAALSRMVLGAKAEDWPVISASTRAGLRSLLD